MKLVLNAGIFLLTPALLILSCGKAKEPLAATTRIEAQNIAVSKVTMTSIADFYEASGTVRAKTTTQVSANVMGRIISFPISEGDTVSSGQTLVQIDNREAQTQLQRAQAGLKEAEASLIEIDKSVEAARAGVKTAEAQKQLAEVTFGRYKQLYERGSASGQEYDEARSRLNVATSELDRANANVQTLLSKKGQIHARIEQARSEIASTKVLAGYSRIVSPVSGVVVKKFAEPGAMTSPGVPLLAIEDNSQYRLEAAVEESRSKLISVGKRVNVRIDALGGTEIYGTVAEVLPAADPTSRSFTVKVDLPPNAALRSGIFGVARFPVSQKEVIAVPGSALVQRGQLTGVFVVADDGTAHFRILTVGKSEEGSTEVLSGLSEGDQIVISDVDRVNEGTKVR
jgi:multidrug efflux pump subunit AcrA (membrane-fusion protein)